jgi:hypothetical protein
VLAPDKPPGKRLPIPDQQLVDARVLEIAIKSGPLDMSDQTVRDVAGQIPGARQKFEVRSAIRNLPLEYQVGKKGRPPKSPDE